MGGEAGALCEGRDEEIIQGMKREGRRERRRIDGNEGRRKDNALG